MDSVAAFNALPGDQLRRDLLSCCAVPAWAEAVAGGRPYPDRAALERAAEAAAGALSWADVLQGLSAHPRIGERAAGDSREAAWSRQEQSAAAGDDKAAGDDEAAGDDKAAGDDEAAGDGKAAGDDKAARRDKAAGDGKAALVAANRAYEERFGHVFLIFASGRTQAEIVAAARERLGNDDATERAVVAGELRKIAMLRLGRLLDGLG